MRQKKGEKERTIKIQNERHSNLLGDFYFFFYIHLQISGLHLELDMVYETESEEDTTVKKMIKKEVRGEMH